MNKQERLKKWVSTLSKKQLKQIAVVVVDELIDSESVSFWEDTQVPYWSATGDNLDGSKNAEE